GETGAPTGWQTKVFNSDLSAAADAVAFAVCGGGASLQTFVFSSPVAAATLGGPHLFSFFLPLPARWAATGNRVDGGPYGQLLWFDAWLQDGVIAGMLPWYPASRGYDSAAAEVRAWLVSGTGAAPNATSSRAIVAVLARPTANAPPPTRIDVV